MLKLMIAGIGTDVGKTVASATLATHLNADYWKPIQCGSDDGAEIKKLTNCFVHPPVYSFKAPLSPHEASCLENVSIGSMTPPQTSRLVIEAVGGVLVPLTTQMTTLDLFASWHCQWIIVSKHYLGSINHTLLTVETLRKRNIAIAGIIFNGTPNPASEEAILQISSLPMLGRMFPEPILNKQIIQRYAAQWTPFL